MLQMQRLGRTDALGAVELVTADGHEVDLVLVHVDWHLAHRLRRICVEEHLRKIDENATRICRE